MIYYLLGKVVILTRTVECLCLFYNFLEIFFLPEVITGYCETSLQWLYNIPEPKLPVKYARKIGNQPTAEENPFNAW